MFTLKPIKKITLSLGGGRVSEKKHLLCETPHSCVLMQHSAKVWELPKCIAVGRKEKKQTLTHVSPHLHGGHNPEIREEFP